MPQQTYRYACIDTVCQCAGHKLNYTNKVTENRIQSNATFLYSYTLSKSKHKHKHSYNPDNLYIRLCFVVRVCLWVCVCVTICFVLRKLEWLEPVVKESQLNTLLSLIRAHHFLSLAILISQSSAVSILTSIPKQPVLSLPLLSTLNLTTVTLSLPKSNLPKSQINRLRQIQNCVARTVVKAPKSSHITPILRTLHWLKINERIEYKLLSLTYKVLTTSQTDYLHNLISVQSTDRTRSSSLVTLAQPSMCKLRNFSRKAKAPYLPHYKSPTALSHMLHLTCGISSLLHSVNLILFTVLLVIIIIIIKCTFI